MATLPLGIIYDTSYLMREEFDSPTSSLKRMIEERLFIKKRTFLEAIFASPLVSGAELFQLQEVVPKEVSAELAIHFRDENKTPLAKRGRKRIVEILERGGTELVLEHGIVPRVELFERDILSSDSKTDGLLIGYGVQQVKTNAWTASIIATDDGGILYDLVKLQKKGVNVFGFSQGRWESLELFLLDLLLEKGMVRNFLPR